MKHPAEQASHHGFFVRLWRTQNDIYLRIPDSPHEPSRAKETVRPPAANERLDRACDALDILTKSFSPVPCGGRKLDPATGPTRGTGAAATRRFIERLDVRLRRKEVMCLALGMDLAPHLSWSTAQNESHEGGNRQ